MLDFSCGKRKETGFSEREMKRSRKYLLRNKPAIGGEAAQLQLKIIIIKKKASVAIVFILDDLRRQLCNTVGRAAT